MKPRILHVIDHLLGDGTQRVLTQLVAGLGARNHRQTVVCLNDSWDANVLDDLRQARAQVRVVGKAALATGAGFVSLWLWLRAERFDVEVTLLFAADVIRRALAHSAGVPRLPASATASRRLRYDRFHNCPLFVCQVHALVWRTMVPYL